MSAQLLHPGVEASKMLEAALQQMDGIIAGTQLDLASLPDRSVSPVATISELAEKLRLALQSSQDDGDFDDVDEETKKFLMEWLKKRTEEDGGSLEDRVNRLEGDKDSLQLQVTVLSEQVEAQTEKIADLENLLEEKKELLRKTEEQLQKEVMTRSSLETQRLELFSEISNLKLRQAAFERENADLREKIRRSDHQSDHAKAQPVLCGIGRSGSGRSITPTAASTPIHSFLVTPDSPQPSHQLAAQLANSPSPSSISTLSTIPASSPNKSPAQAPTVSPASSPVASHDAREFLPPRVSKTPPPNARRKIDQFGTMPRQRDIIMGGETNHGSATTGRTKGVMFGKGLHFLPFRVAGKRSTSAPNLGDGGVHA